MINFIFAGRRGAGLRRLQVRVLQEVHHQEPRPGQVRGDQRLGQVVSDDMIVIMMMMIVMIMIMVVLQVLLLL